MERCSSGPIPKRGDLKVCDNCHGNSLLDVAACKNPSEENAAIVLPVDFGKVLYIAVLT